jgi:hypothetical protein
LDQTGTIIAIISASISSAALVGVVIGLLLQARQLRIGNLQTYRASHAELIRMNVDHPELWADPADLVAQRPEQVQRYSLLNWQLRHLELGYLLGEIREASLRRSLSGVFAVPLRREWWNIVREANNVNAHSRCKRRFFEIVDAECQRAVESATRAVDGSEVPLERPLTSP